MNSYHGIVEVKESSDVNEVNYLLKSGWRLLMVGAAGGRFYYCLGKKAEKN